MNIIIAHRVRDGMRMVFVAADKVDSDSVNLKGWVIETFYGDQVEVVSSTKSVIKILKREK